MSLDHFFPVVVVAHLRFYCSNGSTWVPEWVVLVVVDVVVAAEEQAVVEVAEYV